MVYYFKLLQQDRQLKKNNKLNHGVYTTSSNYDVISRQNLVMTSHNHSMDSVSMASQTTGPLSSL